MPLNWQIGPWVRRQFPHDGGAAPSFWDAPAGAVAALDLRKWSEMEATTGTGLGLFVSTNASFGPEYTSLGKGSWTDVQPTGAARAAIPVPPGYTLTGVTVRDIIQELLTTASDPAGLDAIKPIQPQVNRVFVFGMAGLLRSVAFRWGQLHTNRLKALIRSDVREWFDDVQAGRRTLTKLRMCLGYLRRKYGLTSWDEWKEFVPADLLPEIPGPLEPETTYTEDFDGSDADFGLGKDLSWSGGLEASWFHNHSNKAHRGAPGATPEIISARANHDVSGTDHYTQGTLDITGTIYSYSGVSARFSASANTHYYGLFYEYDDSVYIQKMVAGSATNISGPTAVTKAIPEPFKLEVNGSTLKLYQSGVERISTTDTSITTGTRGGVIGYKDQYASGGAWVDDWSVADLAAGGGILYTQLERGARGFVRGGWTGGIN